MKEMYLALLFMMVFPGFSRADLVGTKSVDESLGTDQSLRLSLSRSLLSDDVVAFTHAFYDAKNEHVAEELFLLHKSVSHNAEKIAQFLIESGADLNLLFDGFSPLMTAITLKKCNMATLLINAGANLNEIVVIPGVETKRISDWALTNPCILKQMIRHKPSLGMDGQLANDQQDAEQRNPLWDNLSAAGSYLKKPLLVATFAVLSTSLYNLIRYARTQPDSRQPLFRRPLSPQQTSPTPKKPNLKPPSVAMTAGEVVTFMPQGNDAVTTSDRGVRGIIEAVRSALATHDIDSINWHLAALRDELKTHVIRASLRKLIRSLVEELDGFASHLSAADALDVLALARIREAVSDSTTSVLEADSPVKPSAAPEVLDAQEVSFGRGALKDVPTQLMESVLEWQNLVQTSGIRAARADSSRNDEAIVGTDLRSVRLNHKYRLFYRVVRDDGAPYVLVTAVNPHQYKRAMKNG